MHGRKGPGRSDTCEMDLKSESQAAALTLLDPRESHIAFQLQNFTLAAGSVFSERSNYFNIRWIKIGSGAWDLDLATFSFSSPALLFAAPYQDILLRSQEPITGVCIRFHAEFLCIETHHEAVGCNGVLFNNVYGVPLARLAPDDEPVFDAIIEQMQAELGLGALATSEILVSYLKIFLIKATRLKISQDARATESLAPRIPPILDRLKALIEQHYRSKLVPQTMQRWWE